jgi:hypothetical protein
MSMHPARLLNLAFLAACGGPPDAGTASTRDSAGITLVLNRDEATLPTWSLEGPVAEIGGRTDSAPYDLNRVRFAARLDDGRLVVLDGASSEIRYFDSAGGHRRTVGGPGSGPGEFQFLGPAWVLPGDTLEIVDLALGRLTRFGPTGDLLGTREVNLRGIPSAFLTPAGRVGTDLVGTAQPLDDEGRPLNTVFRGRLHILRLGEDGRLDTLFVVPGSEWYVRMAREGGSEAFPGFYTPPFARGTVVRLAGEHLVVGNNEHYRIDVMDLGGGLRRSIRLAVEAATVTDADREGWRQGEEEQLQQWRNAPEAGLAQERARIAAAPFPDRFPAYEDLQLGANGELWVEAIRRPGEETRHFRVFDGDGRLRGRLALSPRTRLFHAGADHLVTRTLDEDDVERVRVYRLRRR